MTAPSTSYPDPLALLFGRRSIRSYTGAPVPDAAVQRLLEAGMAAPSAVAKDPARFIVIREKPTLDALAAELSNGGMVPQAGLAIIVCGDLAAAHDAQLSYLLQDCSAAIQNILLAAHGLGLGACWLGIHPRENRIRFIRSLLGIPDTIIPVSAIAVGHAAEQKEPRTRYRASSVHRERW
jgi:nitroreductase